MTYHVVVLTRQDERTGGLATPDLLGDTLVQNCAEFGQKVQSGEVEASRVRSEHVEVLILDPLHERYKDLRRKYGDGAHIVLFFNGAARRACEVYGINAKFASEIEDDQLPINLGTMLDTKYYFLV
jgi:hypothetical protein